MQVTAAWETYFRANLLCNLLESLPNRIGGAFPFKNNGTPGTTPHVDIGH